MGGEEELTAVADSNHDDFQVLKALKVLVGVTVHLAALEDIHAWKSGKPLLPVVS